MKEAITIRNIENLIFDFGGIKVMVDVDLAAMYGTETKKLKQQVKRNIKRFPADFMFILKNEEKDMLISVAPRLAHLKYSSVNPMVFTEQGVAMLSSILNTQKAIQINIEIMRAFIKYRVWLMENADLKNEIVLLDEKFTKAFEFLVERIDGLSPPQKPKMEPVGYRVKRKSTKK